MNSIPHLATALTCLAEEIKDADKRLDLLTKLGEVIYDVGTELNNQNGISNSVSKAQFVLELIEASKL